MAKFHQSHEYLQLSKTITSGGFWGEALLPEEWQKSKGLFETDALPGYATSAINYIENKYEAIIKSCEKKK